MDHLLNPVKPMDEYCTAQFMDPTGGCQPIKIVSEAVEMFNTVLLSSQSAADIMTVLHKLPEKTKHIQ